MKLNRREALGALCAMISAPLTLKGSTSAIADASAEYKASANNDGSITVESGKKEVKFRIGKDAFLLRKNSKIELKEGGVGVKSLSLVTGGVLGVFGGYEKEIKAKTFAAGIRGTGIYLEEQDKDSVYVCLCYGEAEYRHPITGETFTSFKSIHHDKPLTVSLLENGKIGYWTDKTANHDDDELRELEKMCGRKVPFEEWLLLNGSAEYGH